MPFVVCVASDVHGMKVNLELDFPYAPSLPELTSATEQAFASEVSARRPGAVGGFQVSKFHVVDAVTDDWVEVVSANQLRHQCQVYAFQPHSTRFTESQGHIPPATKPRVPLNMGAAATTYRPPPGAYAVPSSGVGYASASASAYADVSRGMGVPGAAGGKLVHVPPLQQVPGAPNMPDNASHDEKVRILFEQTDANHNRMVEIEEMKRIMQVVRIDFSSLTVEDLFRKADHDKDGVVNFPEWQRFAELYPALFDSLYYRLKAHWDHMAAEAQIDAARLLRAQFEQSERNAKDAFERSQLEAADAERRLQEADRATADADLRQRNAEDNARAAALDVDQAKQNRADRERDLAAEREKERQAQLRAQEAARDLEAAQRRLVAAQQGLADAEGNERRMQQALQDAQRDRERQQGVVDQAGGDAQRALDRHNQFLNEIPRLAEEAAALLAAAEQALAAADARQRELGARAGDAAAAAAEARRQREELGKILQALRDRQEPSRLAWLEAQRALEEHDRIIAELEASLLAERDQRRVLDDQEKNLVEQEVRLREQRESLEEKEGALRDAQMYFFSSAGRQSPGRSGSRSPALGGRSPIQASATATATATATRTFNYSGSSGYRY